MIDRFRQRRGILLRRSTADFRDYGCCSAQARSILAGIPNTHRGFKAIDVRICLNIKLYLACCSSMHEIHCLEYHKKRFNIAFSSSNGNKVYHFEENDRRWQALNIGLWRSTPQLFYQVSRRLTCSRIH